MFVNSHDVDKGLENHGLLAGPPPHFETNVSLEDSYIICLPIVYGCFCATKAKLIKCNNREYCNARNFYYLPLRKKLQTPCINTRTMSDLKLASGLRVGK